MNLPVTVASPGPDALRDSWTMLRRNLLQMVRYKSLTLMLIGQPLVFLLLFVYVFGGTMGAGLPGGTDRADYLVYIMPAIVVMTVASISLSTAYTIALDMEKGIVDRFRTMAIAKSSVLTGRVLGAIVLTAAAFLLGYRSDGTALGWLGVVGLVLLMTLALTWLTVALGLSAPNAETASNTPMPLMFLPFLSSGFVPTDSMPAAIRWFAEYQPFTPMIDTLRAWMNGAGAGSDAWLAVGWCLLITLLSYAWARRLYTRVRAS
jgi:ABC-2 type transport system permease protein